MAVKHAFTSAKADAADTTLVNPSDWNDDHTVEASGFELGSGGPQLTSGAGDPESSVTAPAGSVYLRTDGTVYIKASGSGDTGWLAVVTAG